MSIENAEREKLRKPTIRYPTWYKVARNARASQLPAKYKVVFDIECDPSYRKLTVPEKVDIGNQILKGRKPDGDYDELTPELYEEGRLYISTHLALREACSMIYRNLKLADVFMDKFDDLVDKAAKDGDPAKLLAVSREMRAVNRDYAAAHAQRLSKLDRNAYETNKKAKTEKAKENAKAALPNYTKAEGRGEDGKSGNSQ